MAVIAGNWKMNHGPSEALEFLSDFDVDAVPSSHELIIFPSNLSLHAVATAEKRDSRVQVGVQNVYWENSGAFTGEISAPMAKDAGATFALVGHSERRHVFGETDMQTQWKVDIVVRSGLVPVLCVGETIEEREAGLVKEVILRQLEVALHSLCSAPRFLVAYEPVWAIGTGETATPEDATFAHGTIRRRLERTLSATHASRVPILYGGSVKPGNAEELMEARDVDGLLVGGASLDADSFSQIAAAAG